MNPQVTKFLKKSKRWQNEMEKLRAVLLETKLEENFKWSLPCYRVGRGNVVIIQPFKNFLGMMFFKGSLLKDSKKVLVSNGPNSQAGRRFEFHSVQDVTKLKSVIKAYINEAIAIEESGRKVEFKQDSQTLPDELKTVFAKKPKVKKAFESLTPGRKRAYLLHFSSAKRSATRQARIKKFIPHILKGKGPNDL